MGLCPFHTEKTPSFSVHASQQFYKCFGCSVGGDVFKFVMEIERISFFEALKLLAERNGIAMPKREYSDPGLQAPRRADGDARDRRARCFKAILNGPAGAKRATISPAAASHQSRSPSSASVSPTPPAAVDSPV